MVSLLLIFIGLKLVISIRKSNNAHVINKQKSSNGNITSNPTVIANILNIVVVTVSHDITKKVP